jgi:ABC-2 type transport system permease protein
MIRMALHLFGYDLRAFLRNRQSQFFTLALPVLFLVIFASVFGGSGPTQVAGGQISTSVYSSRPLPSSPGACSPRSSSRWS